MVALIFCVVFSAVVYLPCAALPYLFHDDLLFWVKSSPGVAPFALWDSVAAHGRGLAAILISVVGWFVNGLHDLQVLRGLSIVMIGVWAWRWSIVLGELWGSRFLALLTAMVLMTLPAVSIIASRACDVLIPFAWLLSMFAAAIANTGSSKFFLFKGSNSRCWAGSLALAAAYSIHQSAAGMFWAYALAVWLASGKGSRPEISGLKNVLIVGAAAIVIYGIKVQIIANILSPDLRHGIYNPTVLVSDPMNRLAWFITEPLVNVLNFWNIQAETPWIGGSLFAVALFGFFRRYGGKALGMVVVFMLLSFLPNLLAKGEAAFFRCLAPLTVCVVIVFVAALSDIKKDWTLKAVTSVLLVLIVLGGWRAIDNVYRYRIFPSMAETSYTKGIVQAFNPARFERWHVLRRAEPAEARYDEWGKISTDYPHDTFLLGTFAVRNGMAPRVPPYLSSQAFNGGIDYFSIEALAVRRMVRSVLSEVGSKKFLPAMRHKLGSPEVRQYRWEGSLFFFALVGPPVDPTQTVIFDMRDLK
jgi:hypothetical protein